MHKLADQHSGGFLFYCSEDNTVLLVKRSKEMKYPETWSLPGGRPEDEDNNSKETAQREAEEELKVLPERKKQIGKHTIELKKIKYDVYIYEITKQEKQNWSKKIRLDDENTEFEWFNINEIPENTHLNLDWISKELGNKAAYTIMNILKLAEQFDELTKEAGGVLSRRDILKALEQAKKDYTKHKTRHDEGKSKIDQLTQDVAEANDKMHQARKDVLKHHDILRNIDLSASDGVRYRGEDLNYVKDKKEHTLKVEPNGNITLSLYEKPAKEEDKEEAKDKE